MCDYRKGVKEDVRQYIHNEINLEDFDTLDDLRDYLNEELFIEDSGRVS